MSKSKKGKAGLPKEAGPSAIPKDSRVKQPFLSVSEKEELVNRVKQKILKLRVESFLVMGLKLPSSRKELENVIYKCLEDRFKPTREEQFCAEMEQRLKRIEGFIKRKNL